MIDKPRRKPEGRPGKGIATPATASHAVELYTLGRVRLRVQGEEVTDKFGAKHLALLIYLFHERRPMNPSEVIELLGRGQGEETEVEGLSRSVSFLAQKLPGLHIMMNPETIEAIRGVRLDTTDVEDALDRRDPAPVRRAYRGEFLEGFKSGSAEFDAWAEKEGARLKRAWSRAILSSARAADRERDWKNAAKWWDVRVARVPLHDEAVAGLLRALAKAEGKNAAAQAYAQYLARLEEKGQAAPAEQVKKVVSQLRLPKEPPPPEPDSGPAVVETPPEPAVAKEPAVGEAKARPGRAAGAAVATPREVSQEPIKVEVEDSTLPSDSKPTPAVAESAPKAAPEKAPTGGRLAEGPAREAAKSGAGTEGATEWTEIAEVASAEEAEFLLDAMSQASGPGDGGAQDPEVASAAQGSEQSQGAAAVADELDVVSDAQVSGELDAAQAGPDELQIITTAEVSEEVDEGRAGTEDLEIMSAAQMMEEAAVSETAAEDLELMSAAEMAGAGPGAAAHEELEIDSGAEMLEQLQEPEAAVEELDTVSAPEMAAEAVEGDKGVEGLEVMSLPEVSEASVEGDVPAADLDLMSATDSAMLGIESPPDSDLSERRDFGAKKVEWMTLGDFDEEEPPARRPRARRSRRRGGAAKDSALFTESTFVHMVKTAQARLSTPRTVALYQTIVHVTAHILAAAWVGIIKGGTALGRGLLAFGRLAGRKLRALPGSTGRGFRAIGASTRRGGRRAAQAGRRVREGKAATKSARAKRVPRRAKRPSLPEDGPAAPTAVVPDASVTEAPLTEVLSTDAAAYADAAPYTEAAMAGAAAQTGAAPRTRTVAQTAATRLAEGAAAARRYKFVAVALVLIGAVVLVGPKVAAMVGGATSKLTSSMPGLPKPKFSLPDVSLPKITLPKVSVPGIGDMFSGPLLKEPGARLLVADLKADAGAEAEEPTAGSLTAALEADLSQARYFNVVPRERVLSALRKSGGATGSDVPVEQALSLAGTAGYAAVLAGRVGRDTISYRVDLKVLAPSGEELYSVVERVSEQGEILDRLNRAVLDVRRKLGEPTEDIEAGLALTEHLSSSPEALAAYVRARRHLYAGRYSRAVREAQTAIKNDSEFAMAYRVLADAQALRGQRSRARAALERAWELRERLPERERFRARGDRHALDGRLQGAFVAYDAVFERYRDDVGALRSLFVVQRMLGSRGGGQGNLRLAYTIDPYDWPPLSRIARFLGYGGRLPSVDSLVATLEGSG